MNKVKNDQEIAVDCGSRDERMLPETFVYYVENPREYTLSAISTIVEIVFVRGATEAINLVAQAWGRRHINKGDEIVISTIEHHANIVPWQMLCAEKGACLRVAPVDNDGQILLDEYEKLLTPKTRLVSFTQVSNALGTITPAHQMVQMAHRYGARCGHRLSRPHRHAQRGALRA